MASLAVILLITGGVVYMVRRLREQPFREAGSTLSGGQVATQDRGQTRRPGRVAPASTRSNGNKSLVDALDTFVTVMGTGEWLFVDSGDPTEPFKGHYLRVTVEYEGDRKTYIVERLTSDEFLERKNDQTLLVNTFFVYRVGDKEYIARGTSVVVVRLEMKDDDFALLIPPTTEATVTPIPRRILEDVAGEGARSRLLGQLSRVRKLGAD